MALNPFASRNSDLYARSLFSDQAQEQSGQIASLARGTIADKGYVLTRRQQAAARTRLARAGGSSSGGSSLGGDLLRAGAGAAVSTGVGLAVKAAAPAIAAAL